MSARVAKLISVALQFDCIKIWFGGVMHVRFKRSDLRGLQSWRYGDNNYFIEFTLDGGAIMLCEYDDVEKWRFILAELDRLL